MRSTSSCCTSERFYVTIPTVTNRPDPAYDERWIVPWAFAPKFSDLATSTPIPNVIRLFETAPRVQFSSAVVFPAAVLHPDHHRGRAHLLGDGLVLPPGQWFKGRGGIVRSFPSRTDGIGQRDSRSERENLWANLRRKSRDGSLRADSAEPDQCGGSGGRREVLSTSRIRPGGNSARSVEDGVCRTRPAGRKHDHATIGAQQFLAQGTNISPQAARDF